MTHVALPTGAHFHPHLGDPRICVFGFGPNHQPARMGVSLLRDIYTQRQYLLLPFCPLQVRMGAENLK